jgi:hypothetical protein
MPMATGTCPSWSLIFRVATFASSSTLATALRLAGCLRMPGRVGCGGGSSSPTHDAAERPTPRSFHGHSNRNPARRRPGRPGTSAAVVHPGLRSCRRHSGASGCVRGHHRHRPGPPAKACTRHRVGAERQRLFARVHCLAALGSTSVHLTERCNSPAMIVKIAPNHTRGFSVLELGRVRPSPSERVPCWSGEGRWPVPAACPMKQQTGVTKGQSRTERRRSTAAPARAKARTTPPTSLPSWCCRASQRRPSGAEAAPPHSRSRRSAGGWRDGSLYGH